MLQQWLDLDQPVALSVFSSSPTSVKILGLLPLFAAVIAKLILRSFSTLFFVVVFIEDNGKENFIIFFFVYTASQMARLLTAAPSPPLP